MNRIEKFWGIWVGECSKIGVAQGTIYVALTLAGASCNASGDSFFAPPALTTRPPVEELFEVGPMPVMASGHPGDAWMAFCVATATGFKIELVDSPEGGYAMDMRQPGYSSERSSRAEDYCWDEGFTRGYLSEPTPGERQADFEKHVAANMCLLEQGIDQPAAPSTLKEYESSPWHPFATAPMRALTRDEYDELYRLCFGDEHISFVDWEP